MSEQAAQDTFKPNPRHSQAGSVLVLTLIAIGLIASVFLYVAVIGSRANETLRARTSADATAMAAATVKAKVMNYEAFILLADSVLLPLKQVSGNIRSAQATALLLCSGAAILLPAVAKYCLQYVPHVIRTWRNQPKVDREVDQWLDGLEAMASSLLSVGPLWAGAVSTATGMHEDYRKGKGGISAAVAFPIPLGTATQCKDLGIRMAENSEKVQGRDACHDLAWLEFVYLFSHFKPVPFALDVLGMTLTGKLLTLRAACTAENKVPHLKVDWKKYSTSHGMALVAKPSDRERLQHLSGFGNTQVPATLRSGLLLGMGCAEHYSAEHRGQESLWHMDWRARLIPCEYERRERVERVTRCAGLAGLPFSLQFQNERLLGIAKDWKF